MKLMEPTRRLFAEWAAMMQHGPYADFFRQRQAAGGPSGQRDWRRWRPQSSDRPPARLGPRPLGLHLAGAMSMWLSLPAAWPSLKHNWPGLKPELQTRLTHLRTQLGAGRNPEFDTVLAATVVGRTRSFIAGIRAYRQHPAQRHVPAAPVVWQSGTTVLRDYSLASADSDAPVVLAVPSLINRFDILDLDRDHSFLRTFAAQGYRVFGVDWDAPGADEENFGLGDYVTQRLEPILDFLEAKTAPVNLLGYCMGGSLALALASRRPQQVRTLMLMATPWDFHKPDAGIGPHFLDLAAQMEPYLKSLGHLPVDVIQTLFAHFQPIQAMNKFTEFAALDQDSIEARHFVLCEDWLNDGVPLSRRRRANVCKAGMAKIGRENCNGSAAAHWLLRVC